MKESKSINKSKIYSSLIKLIWISILCCWILKIFGYKEFEIPIVKIEINIYLQSILNGILYFINMIFVSLISCKRKLLNKEIILIFILSLLPYGLSLFTATYKFKMIVEYLVIILYGLLLIKDKIHKIIIENTLIYIILGVYQIITMLYKNINITFLYNDFFTELILQIDFYLLLLITTLHNFKKGDYIHDRWYSFYLVLSRRICSKKSLFKNQKIIQKSVKDTNDEVGYKIFGIMLSLFQFILVGVTCYFVNKVIVEYFIIFISFLVLKCTLGKSYHAETIIACTSLALVVFVSATRLSVPLYISIILNILIGLLIAILMYILYYYNKYTLVGKEPLKRGMSKEVLLEKCKICNLTPQETEIMVLFYCDKVKIFKIANKFGYSEANISKIKESILKKFKALDLI